MKVWTRGAVLLACLVVAACQAPATATTRPTIETPSATATAAPATVAPRVSEVPMRTPDATPASAFTLTSSAFTDGGPIPKQYACDGNDISPPLAWTGAPDGTTTLALVMTDPDAGGFVHWVVFNIAANLTDLRPGMPSSRDGLEQGVNSFGRVGYGGPCPPSGTHHYVFRLLALDAALPLTGTPTAKQVLDAAKDHILAEAMLTGTYGKGG